VLAHPRAADLARDAVGVLRTRELEDEDEMALIDLDDLSAQTAGAGDELHAFLESCERFLGERVTEAEVVDDHVHDSDANAR